jgi:nucleoside-diphosphate-sugar epimerase
MSAGAPLVLVTGAGGWLGRAVCSALLDGLRDRPELHRPGNALRVLLLPGEPLPPELEGRVEVVRGDLREAPTAAALCEGARGARIVHAAGLIHPRRVRELFEVNVGASERLFDAAEAAGAGRVVVVSSNSPCGVNPSPEHRFDESAPYAPWLAYGRSKQELELSVKARVAAGRLDAVIVRPPWFYGPFQPARQTLFFEMIRDGRGPLVGGGENLRSMGYVDNLAQGILLALEAREAVGKIYWIADAEPYRMRDVLDTVERLLEGEFGVRCAHRRLKLPRLASSVALGVDHLLQAVGLYHQKIHVLGELDKNIACSIDLARRELGYAPAVALEEGMRRSLAWCFDQGLLRRSA